ncbi:MAG: tetratricopeptide repeat protein [Chitinispirillaceae bacterium]|jgi:tetratricopeptide (TPR) repeat protein
MRTVPRTTGIIITALCAMLCIAPVLVSAKSDDERKAEQLQKEIDELKKKKDKVGIDAKADQDKSKPIGKSLDEIIQRWENLLKDCQTAKKSLRCADALYNLGSLYYDKSRDDYILKREEYEKAMAEYDKKPVGPEPVNPVPDYSKSLHTYEDLAQAYPEFSKVAEAYYQMGNIYLLMGDLDRSRTVYQKIVDEFSQSPRASMAHFKLADLAYLDHDNSEALKHLEKVKEHEVEISVWEMVHYRKGELYYNVGEFNKAIDLFQGYIDRCDAGMYKKQEFRGMALEFMAVCFSDMTNGADEGIKYFEKIGHKPYEDTVMYTIGMKNRTHGQFEDAIKALGTALDHFPYYKDAPIARQMLIECYVIKRQYEKANDEREKLVDDYGPGSAWYSKNSNEKKVIEQSRNEVRKAIAAIAIYYHAIAQKKKDKSAYEKALRRYADFFKEFPDDKWRNYEFRYNIAEIYSALGDCEHAAENYDSVAMQDIAKFPPYQAIVDTLGMDQEEIEKMKKGADQGPVLISQEDAGYNVIVALDNCRKKAMASKGMTEEQTYNLLETKKLLDYAEKFQAHFPKSSNAVDVLYLAGNIHYGAKSYTDAIRVFRQIIDNYPTNKLAEKSLRMLANCYSSSGQFDLAMKMYRQLIAKQKPESPEQMEVIDLAAGATYKRAETLEKSGDRLAAAEAYKSIAEEFSTTKIVDRAWFEAGVCYEGLKDFAAAAGTFESLPVKFPKSTLREKAFLRAADNYKTGNNLGKAAEVYEAAANAITKPEFAIPSLSAASECYQKLNQYDKAGRMFEVIFQRYSNDPKTPQALYNAGLMFEKAKIYTEAINVYLTLSKRFPESEYAAEAFFSVGLCYEKMNQFAEMASVFSDYAQKFANDRFKQVQALVKAGNAFYNMNNLTEAEKDYQMAVSVYEKFHKGSDIDIGDIAEAYYKIGDIYYGKFTQLQLEAKSEKEMKERVKDKTKALEDPAKYYARAIEIGVEEWTIRSTFMIGKGFADMAEAVANQTLFGSAAEKIASKVKILSSLDKYYQKAQEYFYKDIEWAHTQNIGGEYVDKSIDKFMEMMFRKGDIMEEVGRILKSAPVPKSLSKEEKDAYQQVLEEKWLEALDAALPRYIDVVKAGKELGIAQSPWLDKARERIREIKPDADVLTITIEQWKPKPKPVEEQQPEQKEKRVAVGPQRTASFIPEDEITKRELRRIQNIMNMQISAVEKITMLNRIEIEAQRNIELEQEKIKELKQQLQ